MPRTADPELADEIVRVTADLLEQRGIDGVTMRGVAAAVGCSATTIYQRFENKDELLDGAVVRGLEWFVAAQQDADKGGSGRERISATAHAYVEWGIRNPAMYRLMFEQRLPKPAAGDALTKRRRGWELQRDLLAQVFAARPAGAPEVTAEQAADMMLVSLHGIVSLAVSGRLLGPMATREQQLARGDALVDSLVAQWTLAWGLSG